jgi:cytochrome c553
LPAQYPRLAGQFAEYTEAQLKSFRLDERANDPEKMMRTIAAKLSDAKSRPLRNTQPDCAKQFTAAKKGSRRLPFLFLRLGSQITRR